MTRNSNAPGSEANHTCVVDGHRLTHMPVAGCMVGGR